MYMLFLYFVKFFGGFKLFIVKYNGYKLFMKLVFE